jgi:hypothetical protein
MVLAASGPPGGIVPNSKPHWRNKGSEIGQKARCFQPIQDVHSASRIKLTLEVREGIGGTQQQFFQTRVLYNEIRCSTQIPGRTGQHRHRPILSNCRSARLPVIPPPQAQQLRRIDERMMMAWRFETGEWC